MPSRFPLQSLLDHALHRMEAAERLLRMLKHKEAAAAGRLRELESYRDEYRLRLTGGGGRGMGIGLLRDFYGFLAKLDEAIAHQRHELEQASARWRQAHGQWLELRQKVRAYQALAARHAHDQNRRQERAEQRQTDETALRRHVGRRDRPPV